MKCSMYKREMDNNRNNDDFIVMCKLCKINPYWNPELQEKQK